MLSLAGGQGVHCKHYINIGGEPVLSSLQLARRNILKTADHNCKYSFLLAHFLCAFHCKSVTFLIQLLCRIYLNLFCPFLT